MPSAFWTGHPLFTWDPLDQSRYVLIYPARHYADSGSGPRQRPDDALAALLGPTRAAVLRVLGQPHSTSAIAHDVRISLSSASEHAATLRAAGLITTDRHGQAMVHRLSELGAALLANEN
jgi:DNA-binding transcriptional ArsR family regulator